MNIYELIHTYTYMYIHICMYMYMIIYIIMYIHICMYIYTYTDIYIHIYIYIYIYIYLYINTYIYIYILVCKYSSFQRIQPWCALHSSFTHISTVVAIFDVSCKYYAQTCTKKYQHSTYFLCTYVQIVGPFGDCRGSVLMGCSQEK